MRRSQKTAHSEILGAGGHGGRDVVFRARDLMEGLGG